MFMGEEADVRQMASEEEGVALRTTDIPDPKSLLLAQKALRKEAVKEHRRGRGGGGTNTGGSGTYGGIEPPTSEEEFLLGAVRDIRGCEDTWRALMQTRQPGEYFAHALCTSNTVCPIEVQNWMNCHADRQSNFSGGGHGDGEDGVSG